NGVSVWCAGRRCEWKSSPGTSTIGSGAVTVARTRSATWSCCTPTATGRDTREKSCRRIKPRPARGVREGLSRMQGDLELRFLGGGGGGSHPCYPTEGGRGE